MNASWMATSPPFGVTFARGRPPPVLPAPAAVHIAHGDETIPSLTERGEKKVERKKGKERKNVFTKISYN